MGIHMEAPRGYTQAFLRNISTGLRKDGILATQGLAPKAIFQKGKTFGAWIYHVSHLLSK